MENTAKGLSGNQLKIIALICMTIDHIGYFLLPQHRILRMIGRLAFPIFAYMIAEGCRYTRSMGKYLCTMMAAAVICQLIVFLLGSVHMYILVTFSISIALVWLIQYAREKGTILSKLAVAAAILLTFLVAEILPDILWETDFEIDYGFLGIMLPVGVYLCKSKWQKLVFSAVVLALLSGFVWQVQWYSLLSLPLLALYNGKRGKYKMKWLFYIYFPAHLAALWAIAIWGR